jgi:Group 4 capsule polysaccharide lipoprotein gfcB, YjbF
MFRPRYIVTIIALSSLPLLAGCSSGLTAIGQTFGEAFGPATNTEPTLNPRFEYIRVTVRGRIVFLALGIEEAAPGGPVKAWYSADKETLEFQNGRLVGASGLTTEWRKVACNGVPTWHAAAAAPDGLHWGRKRDLMPGYQYGVEDHLTIRRVNAPKSARLVSLDPTRLTWFEERMTTNVPDAALPPAIYAVDMRGGREEVVYGEQCVAKDLCFTWQKWEVAGNRR